MMRTALSSLVVALMIAGCGYKGPLYLPKPKPAAPSPAPPAAQPDAKKSGDDAAKEQ